MDPARELRELRRIEHRLTAEDPELAALLSALGSRPRKAGPRWPPLAACTVGAVTAVFTFVFLGVLVLMVGACLHTTGRQRSGG